MLLPFSGLLLIFVDIKVNSAQFLFARPSKLPSTRGFLAEQFLGKADHLTVEIVLAVMEAE